LTVQPMPTTEINVSRETSGFCNSDSGISGDLITLIQEFLVEDSSVGASLDFSMATSTHRRGNQKRGHNSVSP
jgi:hypothetical protein